MREEPGVHPGPPMLAEEEFVVQTRPRLEQAQPIQLSTRQSSDRRSTRRPSTARTTRKPKKPVSPAEKRAEEVGVGSQVATEEIIKGIVDALGGTHTAQLKGVPMCHTTD